LLDTKYEALKDWIMAKKTEPELEQLALFDTPPEPVVELTLEQKVNKKAREIFTEWYDLWYVGRYTQKAGHIIKVFKAALNASVAPDDIFWAANILGKDQKPITELNLQWALGQVFQEKKRENASVDFTDKQTGGYGETF
jgi:hypothetical protein